jgi:hypothetical protein
MPTDPAIRAARIWADLEPVMGHKATTVENAIELILRVIAAERKERKKDRWQS